MTSQVKRVTWPIRLGGPNGQPYCRLEPEDDETIQLAREDGQTGTLRFSVRGAALLGESLLAWANPRRRPAVWGVAEIQARYDVSATTVRRWRAHADFPATRELAIGPVWEASAVRRWVKYRRRRPGRPPKRANG